MAEITVLVAFSIGLLSTLHCLGMCSGIIGALSFSLPDKVRHSNKAMLPYLMGYNLGRIFSYTVAGLAVGAISGNIFSHVSPRLGHLLLETTAASILLLIGLHLAGWFPRLISLEKIGKPIWKRLEPWGRRLLPVQSPWHAAAFGTIWGWLPCGLVYSTLLWAGSSGTAMESALLMLAFGVGTLPTTLFAGYLSGWLSKVRQNPLFRKGAGTIIMTIALVSLFFALDPNAHELTHWGGMKTHAN